MHKEVLEKEERRKRTLIVIIDYRWRKKEIQI